MDLQPKLVSHQQPIFLETFFLILLRAVYGFLCRRLLLSALNPTLRELSVSENPDLLPITNSSHDYALRDLAPSLGRYVDAETDDDVSLYNTTPISSLPPSPSRSVLEIDEITGGPVSSSGQKLQQPHVLQLNHGRNESKSSPHKRGSKGLGRLARLLFCVCFAEACNLVTLVIFHTIGVLHAKSRLLNFTFSLHLNLACILLVVPLIQCLLLTFRCSSTGSKISFRSRMLVACIPFALYCFLFTCIPPYVNTGTPAGTTDEEAPVTSDWNGHGWFASILGRVIVLGIVTLSGLSGFGAMRTAWNFVEHVKHGRSPPLLEIDISRAEQSLYRIRQDILVKRQERQDVQQITANKHAKGWVGRLLGGRDANGDWSELQGLEAMELQMSRSLIASRRRKSRQEFSRTVLGRFYYLLGFCFAIYCAARLLMCLPSIFFPPVSTNVKVASTKGSSNGDWISYLLALALSHLPRDTVDIDVALWSRTISLLLTGLLILSSMAQILRSVSKIVRLTSKAAGASFLLLGLGQLLSVYVISLLVQMRTSLPPSAEDGSQREPGLLETLPDFRTFGRLFDTVFLIAAVGTACYRYVAHRVASDA